MNLIEEAEAMRATIVILLSEYGPGERLFVPGGIAALLRNRPGREKGSCYSGAILKKTKGGALDRAFQLIGSISYLTP